MKFNNKAFTLIEVLVCVILSVILIIGLINFFSSGLKGSAKTLNMQDNMEAANILMAQIEHDFLNATEIKIPEWNKVSNGSAQWISVSDSSIGSVQYTYDYVSGSKDGVHRKVFGNKINLDHYIAKNHLIDLKFTHYAVDVNKNQNNEITSERHGIWVELTVYSSKDKDDKDAFTLKKLISVKKPI